VASENLTFAAAAAEVAGSAYRLCCVRATTGAPGVVRLPSTLKASIIWSCGEVRKYFHTAHVWLRRVMQESTANNLALESVSEFLVSNTYLLTALELFQESLERGVFIPQLHNFFSQDEFLSLLGAPKAKEGTQGAPSRRKRKMDANTEQEYQLRIKTLEYDLRFERQNLQVLRREVQVSYLFEKLLIRTRSCCRQECLLKRFGVGTRNKKEMPR
jgi:hypothetical protein